MEIEKDKWVEIEKKNNIITTVYVPSNYSGPIAIDSKIPSQPERSKREDQIEQITPPKLNRSRAIKEGKLISKIKKYAGVNEELFGCGALNTQETE